MKHKIETLSDYIHEYEKSVNDPEKFWGEIANTFNWQKPYEKVLDWNFDKPEIKWFVNGKLNITENIFERNLIELGDKPAIIWEPSNPEEASITLTYQILFEKTCQLANAMQTHGIKKGDRVVIYMPMVPEAAIAMLACARIGAIHSIVFAGFSANALSDRIDDCQAKMVLTSDGNFRGNKAIPVKAVVDDAIENCPFVESVFVLKRTNVNVTMKSGRDVWWHDAVNKASLHHSAEIMDAEDMLFILYTSGSTGKPKGVVHTTAGYMVYTHYSFVNVFQYTAGDVFWCTADVGWITGHSYIVYGPLLAGATTLMFEGVPTYPHPGRFWEIIDKHHVNQFYTAPTAIRALQAFGTSPITPYKLDSLKVIGSVGEPINEEAWHWYHNHIGKGNCP
ncbi:MAG: AMP-binding protein, partial [Flammeovirgaceae bacterium]|nr:AMP-binding protein [Flammeovirgaceae bacterium]